MSPELQALIYAVGFGPCIWQIYRIRKSGKKLVSKDIKLTAINMIKINFYEPFLIYDFIKLVKQKVDKNNKNIKSKGSSFYHST